MRMKLGKFVSIIVLACISACVGHIKYYLKYHYARHTRGWYDIGPNTATTATCPSRGGRIICAH